MVNNDIEGTALRIEAAIKMIIEELDDTIQNDLLSRLTDILEHLTIENLVDLFIEISNLPETPSTVAYLMDYIDQTTVSAILAAWMDLEEYESLGKVLEFSSDHLIDISYTQMTDAQKIEMYPFFSANTISKLPQLVLFQISNLILEPDEVEPGEEVEVNFKVANNGELVDIYRVPVIIDETIEKTFTNVLSPGESDYISLFVERELSNEYLVRVGDRSSSFTVVVPVVINPALFIFESLRITPEEIVFGDPISIFVTIYNSGDVAGSEILALELDSQPVDSKIATINPRERMTLIFNVDMNYDKGSHSISSWGFFSTNIDIRRAFEYTMDHYYYIVISYRRRRFIHS